MTNYTVPPYRYEPGKGALICDGSKIVATVQGTSYPLGSACEADYALARVMAAAPEMLAALKACAAILKAHKIDCIERGIAQAAIAKAEGK